MSTLATGRLNGDQVTIEDTAEANRLHNKSHAGDPQTGNTLRLSIVEAVHCIGQGWLDVNGCRASDLLRQAATSGEQTEVDVLAYSDLRERGLTVRHSGVGFDVWKRGDGRNLEPWFHVRAFAERTPLTATDLAELAGSHVAVVDEDGAVTHYSLQVAVPNGDIHAGDLPSMKGALLDDRVMVPDEDAAASLAAGFWGADQAGGRMLSMTEAESLRRQGVLDVDADLPAHGASRQPMFHLTVPVHDALRAAGVVTRSGFRFGTHLRGYAADPDNVHAEWLIHCAGPEDVVPWSDLSRGVRLAHGVRKRFLVAVVEEPVRFVEASWFKP